MPTSSETSLATVDRTTLEHRLVAAEAEIERLLPPDKRFEREPRSVEVEVLVKPFADKVFHTGSNAATPYELECHGRVCRIIPTGPTSSEWLETLQIEAGGLLDGRSEVTPGRRGAPPKRAFVTVSDRWDAGLAPGYTFLSKLLARLGDQSALMDCQQAHPSTGTVTLEIVLAADRRLQVRATGELADRPGGACIRKVFEEFIAGVEVPPEVTSLPTLPIPIEFSED